MRIFFVIYLSILLTLAFKLYTFWLYFSSRILSELYILGGIYLFTQTSNPKSVLIIWTFICWVYYCNVVATWPRHVISLVITLNDIPLSPPIALTYHFCSWWLAFLMHQTSFIYLLGIDSPSSHRWDAPSRHPYCHPTIFPFVGNATFLDWIPLGI